jgi:hypothetical protein
VELATGMPSVQSSKPPPVNAWSQFLQRVLVSVGRDGNSDPGLRAAERLIPRLTPVAELGKGPASEQ